MNPIIYIAIGIIIGITIAQLLLRPKQMNKKAQELQSRKQDNKKKILSYLKEHHKITNNQVEELIKVGDTSAYKYLEELEQEGEIEQKGEKGRNVYYQLK